jgi:hypothetical protein
MMLRDLSAFLLLTAVGSLGFSGAPQDGSSPCETVGCKVGYLFTPAACGNNLLTIRAMVPGACHCPEEVCVPVAPLDEHQCKYDIDFIFAPNAAWPWVTDGAVLRGVAGPPIVMTAFHNGKCGAIDIGQVAWLPAAGPPCTLTFAAFCLSCFWAC